MRPICSGVRTGNIWVWGSRTLGTSWEVIIYFRIPVKLTFLLHCHTNGCILVWGSWDRCTGDK